MFEFIEKNNAVTNFNYSLYQINLEKLENYSLTRPTIHPFLPFAFQGPKYCITKDNYDLVTQGFESFSGSTSEFLEHLFNKFNTDAPRAFRSMSVSDVVTLEYIVGNSKIKEAYYCDSFGFKLLQKIIYKNKNNIRKEMELIDL